MATQVESIKWIPGTRFIVDGFRFISPLCTRYFLTHAHTDHTTGLTPSFSAGLIYCTRITYNLLVNDMGVPPIVLRPLELDVPIVIDGVEVTPVCANHCPGACCFIFKISSAMGEMGQPRVVFHTGDFRWSPQLHGAHPALANCRVDTLMLDTTYCAPQWTFPSQDVAIHSMAEVLKQEYDAHPSTLFVCSSYHVGKERAYFGAARLLGFKVWVEPAKRRILRLLDLPPNWLALLADCPEEAQLHVLGGGDLGDRDTRPRLHDSLENLIAGSAQWTRAVLIRPTGWNFRKSSGNIVHVREASALVTIVSVPYSEHSSFDELQDCVHTLRPKRLIPTVNAADARKSRALVDRLCGGMDLRDDKSRLDAYFSKKNTTGKGGGGALAVDVDLIDAEEQRRRWSELTSTREGSGEAQVCDEGRGAAEAESGSRRKRKGSSIRSYFSSG